MRFDILTLFPDFFRGFLEESLIKKALERGLLAINVLDIRDQAEDKHNTADDSPFGGGPGMVMLAEPVMKTLDKARTSESKVVLMSPAGKKLTQQKVKALSGEKHLIIVCGRYEGIDERVSKLVDEEISIGDYVLSGGELPAAVLVEAVSRYVPGVVKERDSVDNDSFSEGLLDFPHYTRPSKSVLGDVPEVLLGGNHAETAKWRRKEQLKRTLFRRPDLLGKAGLSEEDGKLIQQIISDAQSIS
jgi:tRNA (guanine37-N1)-methyltransferase